MAAVGFALRYHSLNHQYSLPSAADFETNRDLTGARKRSLDSGDDDDDSGEEDFEDDDNKMVTAAKPKKSSMAPRDKTVNDLAQRLSAVDLAAGRVAGVPLHGLLMEGGIVARYWSWTFDAKWHVDIEILQQFDQDDSKDFTGTVSPDGKFFIFKSRIPQRLLEPGKMHAMTESFGGNVAAFPNSHPRKQKYLEMLHEQLEENGGDYDSDGFKRTIKIPLPFVCLRTLNDPHADPLDKHRCYGELCHRQEHQIPEFDYVIRACCVAAAEPVVLAHNAGRQGPKIKLQGTVLTADDVMGVMAQDD